MNHDTTPFKWRWRRIAFTSLNDQSGGVIDYLTHKWHCLGLGIWLRTKDNAYKNMEY